MYNDNTIVALATPTGVGAIGVIRLSGADAINIAQSVFSKQILNKPSHTLHFGKIINNINNEVVDEVVLSIFKEPKSYTGENVIEISCHGSPFIQQKLIEVLVNKGARLAKPGEFTLRAFLNGKLDLAQAEAVADLIASDSEVSHKMAISQMKGEFSNKIKNLRQSLINFASLIELELDFGEEDVEFANRKQLYSLVEEISEVVRMLKKSFVAGNVLKKGIATVIAGKPNAGKSTVLNALLNEDRAIVSNIAGTTRDTIEESLNINGVLFRIIDTAGIRVSTNEIEDLGINKTFENIEKADLILYVFDAKKMTKNILNDELKSLKTSKKIIAVANKTDLCEIEDLDKEFNNLDYEIVFISAINKEIKVLLNVLEKYASELNKQTETIINNSRHYESLYKTEESLNDIKNGLNNSISSDLLALDIRQALHHLSEITGEISSEDLLDNIFSRFCIGK
ncbi:MAG: tRNA uridine-5-carboxymethylaminomethyl(34) synthesis GTPase MnmE [Bacteroidia bacterium]|nr:tRNA uridine-5-carboxymethylaminomethyl(34) synthesis GTPase MnmE [Bacteroidia bacterium]